MLAVLFYFYLLTSECVLSFIPNSAKLGYYKKPLFTLASVDVAPPKVPARLLIYLFCNLVNPSLIYISSAWRFPSRWPFPDEFTAVVNSSTSWKTSYFNEATKQAILQHLTNYIAPSSSVLELGCESARILPTSKSFLNLYSLRRIKDYSFSLPFTSGSFDHVVLAGGVEYIAEPRELFRELWRVLRPGGRLFVCFLDAPVGPRAPEGEGGEAIAPSGGSEEDTPAPLQMWATMTAEQKIWIAGR